MGKLSGRRNEFKVYEGSVGRKISLHHLATNYFLQMADNIIIGTGTNATFALKYLIILNRSAIYASQYEKIAARSDLMTTFSVLGIQLASFIRLMAAY